MYRFIEENIHGCGLKSSVVGRWSSIAREWRGVCSIFEHSYHDFVSKGNAQTRSVHHTYTWRQVQSKNLNVKQFGIYTAAEIW